MDLQQRLLTAGIATLVVGLLAGLAVMAAAQTCQERTVNGPGQATTSGSCAPTYLGEALLFMGAAGLAGAGLLVAAWAVARRAAAPLPS